MRIALVDDEQLHLNILKEALLSALGEIGLDAQSIECYTRAEEFADGMEADKYDIIILDIYMDTAHGIDIARRIRERDAEVALAFCTSSNEYASQSYEVDARYYLQKPISREKVLAMLKRLDLSRLERNRSIRLPDGCRVPLRHIVYSEYINHSVRFHIREQKPRTVYLSQGDAEKLLLTHKGFCVINKGCIVNFAQVKKIDTNVFVMQNGEVLPIARRRFKDIESAYTQYVFDKLDGEVSD